MAGLNALLELCLYCELFNAILLTSARCTEYFVIAYVYISQNIPEGILLISTFNMLWDFQISFRE